MEGIKKAKIYGAVALIFFIIFIILIFVITLLTGTSVRADDTIGMMIVAIAIIFFYLGIILPIVFTILAVYTYNKYRTKIAPMGGNGMDKQLVTIIGGIILLIGFVLLITGISNYNALMEHVGWYLDVFPSSTRYNQEISNYGAMSFIGLILLVGGIGIAAYYGSSKKNVCSTNYPVGEKQFTPVETPQKVNKIGYCFQCGAKHEGNPDYCFECGTKLR